MHDLNASIVNWTDNNKEFAMATVIKTWGSSPRPVGSAMLISSEMEMVGSVSGGCVENSVITAALPLIERGESQRLAFGVTDEDAWSVGLSCGGKIQVFVERFMALDERPEEQAVWAKLNSCLNDQANCILVTKLVDGVGEHLLVTPDGEAVGANPNEQLIREALKANRERKSQVIELGEDRYFARVFTRPSQMLIIGAAHITVDLVDLAKKYNFETIVIDPRGVFSEKTQFKTAPDQIITKYPSDVLGDYTLDQYAYAVVLSHDPKIDDDALHILLRSDVGYIGALGSSRTHAKRVKRLTEAGFTEEELAKIHAPIGVDIKAKWPAEIALSIMGEIIKEKNRFL